MGDLKTFSAEEKIKLFFIRNKISIIDATFHIIHSEKKAVKTLLAK